MDLTDTPNGVPAADEETPDFDVWEDPEELVRDGPIRERLLDVVTQLREPTKVSVVAERTDCDTETAREYLEWFTSMGIVREQEGRPVRYERNDSFLRWRRVERIREAYSEREIVDELERTIAELQAYRERYDAESPDEVSLTGLTHEQPIEEAWEVLSEWETLERRAELLDAARRDADVTRGNRGHLNA